MKYIFLALLVLGRTAAAQNTNDTLWINADYTYNQLNYSQTSYTEKGSFAGARGEVGLKLTDFMGFSGGGEYMDSNFSFNGTDLLGTTVTGIGRNYIRDLRGLVHLFYGPIVLSGGVAQRERLDDNGTYRERDFYSYYPAMATLYRGQFYLRVEADVMSKGHSHLYMSDVGPGRSDVNVDFGKGQGYGGEMGLFVPTALGVSMHVFVNYHHWEIQASGATSDGISTVSIPKNTTDVLAGGLGLSF